MANDGPNYKFLLTDQRVLNIRAQKAEQNAKSKQLEVNGDKYQIIVYNSGYAGSKKYEKSFTNKKNLYSIYVGIASDALFSNEEDYKTIYEGLFKAIRNYVLAFSNPSSSALVTKENVEVILSQGAAQKKDVQDDDFATMQNNNRYAHALLKDFKDSSDFGEACINTTRDDATRKIFNNSSQSPGIIFFKVDFNVG